MIGLPEMRGEELQTLCKPWKLNDHSETSPLLPSVQTPQMLTLLSTSPEAS